jgi:hypothetical protein
MNSNFNLDDLVSQTIYHSFKIIQKRMHKNVFIYIVENQKEDYVSKKIMLSKPPFLRDGYFVDKNFDDLFNYKYIVEDMLEINLLEIHPIDKDLIKITNKGNDKLIDIMVKEKERKKQEEQENK